MTDKVRTLGPGTLKIGETSSEQKFDVDATKVTLTPEVSEGDTITFLDGSQETDEATITYKLSGTIKEDYSAAGCQAFCWKNQGKIMPFTFKPNNNASLEITGKVTVRPLAVGGDVKAKNDIDFEFKATDVDMNFQAA